MMEDILSRFDKLTIFFPEIILTRSEQSAVDEEPEEVKGAVSLITMGFEEFSSNSEAVSVGLKVKATHAGKVKYELICTSNWSYASDSAPLTSDEYSDFLCTIAVPKLFAATKIKLHELTVTQGLPSLRLSPVDEAGFISDLRENIRKDLNKTQQSD